MAGAWRRKVSFGLLLLLTGCASYSSRIAGPRAHLERGEYDLAVASLTPLVEANDNDQLLYLMDLGVVYHSAGRYEEATKTFLKAEKIAEIKDYTSLSEEAVSFLVNEDAKTYKGEHFEKLLINVYLAIDYTMMGRWDDALVECRKVNHRIDLMIREGKLPYTQNGFAKYLAATLFEAEKEYNDALVDYRMLLKWDPSFPYLAQPLLRLSDRLKMSQEFDEFKSRFPTEKDFRIKKNEGEIILLVEQGKSPVKVPSEQFHFVPRFDRRSYSSDFVYLKLKEQANRVRSFTLFDIENVAIAELDHRIALIAAKRVGSMVAKELITQKIEQETKNPGLGLLLRLLFYSAERADTRSWTTLPAKLQLARLTVPAGRHNVALDMVWRSGTETPGIKVWENVDVKPGQKVFLTYRTPD